MKIHYIAGYPCKNAYFQKEYLLQKYILKKYTQVQTNIFRHLISRYLQLNENVLVKIILNTVSTF